MAEKTTENLNRWGIYCYGIKSVVRLIEHFGYDFEEWREVLECLCDYTEFSEIDHERNTAWIRKIEYCSPTGALEPVIIDNYKGYEHFFPCDDDCKNPGWIFSEYGAEGTFCINFKNCEYVINSYRFTRLAQDKPEYKRTTEGKYKEYYDLYMRTDINLSRMIEETLQVAYGDLSFDYLNCEDKPILYDMINVFKSLGIDPPDCDGIPDAGFLEKKMSKYCFDCRNLIDKKFKENIHV